MPHEQPRVEVFVDKEVQQSSVYVSFKHALPSLSTPARPNPTLSWTRVRRRAHVGVPPCRLLTPPVSMPRADGRA